MRFRLSLLLLLLGLPAASAPASEPRTLSEESRAEMRRQMRDHWQQEGRRHERHERQNAKERQSVQVPRAHDLPPDERQRLRREIREEHQRRHKDRVD